MSTGLEELGIVDDDAPIAAERPQSASEDGAPQPAELDIESVLEGVYLFAGLLPAHLRRIAKLAHYAEHKKGDFIFRHGDDGDGLYLVLEGAIRISRNASGMGEEALAVLRDGAHFGEMSLIDDDVPRSADAVCHENARLLKLPKHDLRDLMFVDRELAYELLWRFVRNLSGRLRDSNDRLMMLTASSKF
jgi:CRP/FNR family cyclic AMP-dependent transcriptional regulator